MHRIYLPQESFTFRRLVISGKDSQDFLHRITTAGISSLEIGKTIGNLLLDATGNIEQFFFVTKKEDSVFSLDWPHVKAQSPTLLESLERFHFAEDLHFEWIDLKPMLFFSSQPEMDGKKINAVRLPNEWLGEDCFLCYPEEKADSLTPSVSSDEFETQRMKALMPAPGKELNAKTKPLSIGYQWCIDRNKGCYPGQEVIEKVFTYSEPPQRLVLGKANSSLECGDALTFQDKAGGTVTSIGPDKLFLAFVGKTFLNQPLCHQDRPVEVLKVSPYEKDV